MLEFLATFPPEIAVILASLIPLIELRGSIPLGIVVYGLPWFQVFVLAMLGNALFPLIVYGVGEPAFRWAESRQDVFHRVAEWVKVRARRKFKGDGVGLAGLIALALFVGVPLPGTGALTGSVAALLLRIPFRKAFLAIVVGNAIAATAVTLAATGAVAIFKVFL